MVRCSAFYLVVLHSFRRHICEFLDQLLHTWPTHALEKHVAALQVTILCLIILKAIKDVKGLFYLIRKNKIEGIE